MTAKTLANNLILDLDGKLYCKDGQNVQEYLRNYISNEMKAKGPVEVNILTHRYFKELLFKAQLNCCA